MRIIRLLGALAVLSLILMPAALEDVEVGCSCLTGGCHRSSQAQGCCDESEEASCPAQVCSCPVPMASLSGAEFYDPWDMSFGRGHARNADGRRISPRPDSSGSEPSGLRLLCSKDTGPPDPDVVQFLPPSAKQIFGVLAASGPLTQKDLISSTDLPPRTVRYALSKLKGEDMLRERFCFRDARQILYSLKGM